jgi:hypothetical protein
MTRRTVCWSGLGIVGSFLVSSPVFAQSGIAGVVRDTTGAVLPGVTVEAAGPALIEKTRTVTSDDQGQYKILELPPGTYVATFTLTGFSTVKREGIELTSNFTAQVNADLHVASVEETITVSGASQLVDVQNVISQRVVTQALIEALPTSRIFQTLAATIPGVQMVASVGLQTQDVGGTAGDQSQMLVIHGSHQGDMENFIDGFPDNQIGGVNANALFLDVGSLQEVNYQLGANTAEVATGGVHVNFIPKAGGNKFSGSFVSAFTNHKLENNNSNLQAPSAVDKIWDEDASVGGPIRTDRLWFFASGRYWGLDNFVANMWANQTPSAIAYAPDFSHPAIDDSWLSSGSVRLTWQLSPKTRLVLYDIHQGRCLCHNGVSATRSPEAARVVSTKTMRVEEVLWTAPVSSRTLVEAGVFLYRQDYRPSPEAVTAPYAVSELSTGLNFGAASNGYLTINDWTYNYKGSVSYVTGSNAAKLGFDLQNGTLANQSIYNGNLILQLLRGVPSSLIEEATPYVAHSRLNAALGIYAQDQLTIKRLTANVGLRFDYLNASVPAQYIPATEFLPARSYAAVNDVPNWKDIEPRLGIAYDLSGRGRTAIKATLSRYVQGGAADFANLNNPLNTSVNSVTRTWNDVSGTLNPLLDCDVTDPQANGGCGQIANAAFGTPVITTQYDNAVKQGWGVRGYNWELSSGIQHEIVPRIALNASYYRRWYGNFLVTDNLVVGPGDFSSYCLQAPSNPLLPGGGGYQVCGLEDVNPAKFGQVQNLITLARNYGSQSEVYNGVDLTLNARLGKRAAQIIGGMSIGRTETNNCDVVGKVDNPASANPSGVAGPSTLYCDVKPPFQPNVKISGSYPLPWSSQASAVFQSLPGPQIAASDVVTNQQVSPSLGRNLAAGPNATATVPLIAPGTLYGNRLFQLDGRFSKILKVGSFRIQGNFDVYNLLNSSTNLIYNSSYGSAWLQPVVILPGRLFKFSAQVDF